MEWYYKCPNCKKWLHVNWLHRGEMRACKECKITHKVPNPIDQHEVYDNKGETSVENFQPMCEYHNSSEGKQNFDEWLEENGLTIR